MDNTERTICVGENYLNYRYGVGLCLFSETGNVLLGKKLFGQKRWHMPQGGAGQNEKPRDTFFREAMEELHLQTLVPLATIPQVLIYNFSDRFDFAGQGHLWVAGYVADPKEINVSAPPAGVDPEFSETQWVPIEKLSTFGPQSKFGVYFKVASRFASIAKSIKNLRTHGPIDPENLPSRLLQENDIQCSLARHAFEWGVMKDFPTVPLDNKYLNRVLRPSLSLSTGPR